MATRKYTQHRNRMHPPPLIVILIVTKAGGGGGGGFDTILYSQHATKIGSHTARGTITKHHRHYMCDPGFELNLFWKSNPYLISFLVILITRFSGN